MNEELSQEDIEDVVTDKQSNNRPWLFKKGQSGNPLGRPMGKSLKEYSREYLSKMTEKERLNFLEGLPKVDIWKMAEGNPKQDVDADVTVTGPALIRLDE